MEDTLKDYQRIIIEKVSPEIDGGLFPINRIVGEEVLVQAVVFADGHDDVLAKLLYRKKGHEGWNEIFMNLLGNDIWEASFLIEEKVPYEYTVKGYIDEFSTWKKGLQKKWDAGLDVAVDLEIGAQHLEDTSKRSPKSDTNKLKKWIKILDNAKKIKEGVKIALSDELNAVMCANLNENKSSTYLQKLQVNVERRRALFSTWYEFFPRSWAKKKGTHGTFKNCETLLPEISRMGFDIIYLPPIHPIGTTHRKGKNNNVKCESNDPGSPWAIGNKEGGHKAINPNLGTLEDFKNFIKEAKKYDIEIAMDIAFQCSPDHPYVKDHPSWFKWRPDGTIQFAENPPKKYEDILPLNFDTQDWENLWKELKGIFLFWIKQGIQIFRVDNPHTKPFAFWDWLISEIKRDYPDVIFLSEAFTRPHIMYRLAKGGFCQSYTYFTWRHNKYDFTTYVEELTKSQVKEYFRPNFWPNTPDILATHLQRQPRQAFVLRYILAATLSSNCGIYGPAFELCENEPIEDKEEYFNSEKYEIKSWDWDKEGNIKDIIAKINQIRKSNKALQTTKNVKLIPIENENIFCYWKYNDDCSNIVLVAVNLDPHHTQSGWLQLPLEEWGMDKNRHYSVKELLGDQKFSWKGESNYVELNPQISPAHIILIR